jgi:hypothetical protein
MEREEVVRIAREKLGATTSRMATGEYAMLARLLHAGEAIEAMVLGVPAGRFRLLKSAELVVATDRRLLLVSKSWLTRRERVEEFPREHVRGARLESPTRFVLELHEGDRVFSLGMPHAQTAALLAHADRSRGPSRFEELDALARRKLGRLLGFGVEDELLLLDGELLADEAVLDLAWATKSPDTLIAVCPERLILVPDQPMRSLLKPVSIPFDTVEAVDVDGSDLVLRFRGDERRLGNLVPDDAEDVLATRIRARVAGNR